MTRVSFARDANSFVYKTETFIKTLSYLYVRVVIDVCLPVNGDSKKNITNHTSLFCLVKFCISNDNIRSYYS